MRAESLFGGPPFASFSNTALSLFASGDSGPDAMMAFALVRRAAAGLRF